MAAIPSQLLQNYHQDCEAAVNRHIQLQLYASYVYLSMAFYCDRDKIALGHFKRFFLSKSHKLKASAKMFMFLQNKRGGRIAFHDISRPDRDDWHGGFQAMECAFHLEKTINQSLLDLHHLATEKGNGHLCDFLKCYCLHQQVEIIKEMGSYLTNLRQMGAPEDRMAEYLFDKLTLAENTKED
uniref:ferritin heavy polypeptide-like 17 n=1 Tax=Jaculus jaculus TaxID=51337 RepID=UPI0003330B36|nr:ferritin heavy polypeptide-like 17 [Jaculus jaculus]